MDMNNIKQENSRSHIDTINPSSQEEIDYSLNILKNNKDAWTQLDTTARITILDQIKDDLHKCEKEWVAASMAAKNLEYETMGEAEEWAGVTIAYRQIRFLRKSLKDIIRFGQPKISGKLTTRSNGQVVAQVIPFDWKEKIALPGIKGEVWMDPNVSIQNGTIPQASFYRTQNKKGQVCIVLGAGNFSCLITSDFLYKLFVEGQVVALKMNPANEYLGPILKKVYACLIKSGYLQILYGGVDEGTYLCNHSAVDSIHMTGSNKTFEAIVFGSAAEGKQRKASRNPLVRKPFSAELGSISPVIVVPGPWTDNDVKKQAARIGSWLVPNAGCNCLTPRMIVQMKSWDSRKKLIDEIGAFLSKIPTRKAYYPGSIKIHKQFSEAHPKALQLGDPLDGHLPWTFITDIDSESDDICLTSEPFTSLFSETALEASDVANFIGKAVDFVNDSLWGTLSASIVVHPKSMKNPEIAAAVDSAIANLRYGSIVVNNSGVLDYYLSNTLWGGYPGSDIYDVQSGIGFVNNPLMFDCPQKSVVYADFDPIADPFLADSKNNHLWFRQDTRFTHSPTVWNLFNLIWKAIMIK